MALSGFLLADCLRVNEKLLALDLKKKCVKLSTLHECLVHLDCGSENVVMLKNAVLYIFVKCG
jgi:hypothetical protein